WTTDTGAANAEFFLNKFDELDEFGNGVEAKQWQKPAVEFERLGSFAFDAVVEEVDRFFGKCIGETRDPAHRARLDALEDGVIDADENCETIFDERADGRDAADVRAGFFYGLKVCEFFGEFFDLFRREIRAVGDRIVVEHARKARGFEDR